VIGVIQGLKSSCSCAQKLQVLSLDGMALCSIRFGSNLELKYSSCAMKWRGKDLASSLAHCRMF